MSDPIEAKEIKVLELFNDHFVFEIPGYQRQYSWQDDNFHDLFDDIRGAMENGENQYFLGSIILQLTGREANGGGRYDVVDGQQRLTTLSILIAVLRDSIHDVQAQDSLQTRLCQQENLFENRARHDRLIVRERDRSFFEKAVLVKDGTLVKNETASESEENMACAIAVFCDRLSEMTQEDMRKLVRFLLNQTYMVYVKTEEFGSAYRLFTVLNQRGMSLSTADFLKNINLQAVDAVDQRRFQMKWETTEQELGSDQLDGLLGDVRTVLVKDKAKDSVVAEYERIIYPQRPGFKGAQFIDYLEKMARIYQAEVKDGESYDPNGEVDYFNLVTLMDFAFPSADWVSAILAFSYRFRKSQYLLAFLEALERRIVVDWILRKSPTVRLRRIIDVIKTIEDGVDEKYVLAAPIFSTGRDADEFMGILDSTDFYHASHAKYVLLRLDEALSDGSVKRQFTSHVSIEHVLPRHPIGNYPEFSEESRTEWTHRLGNLVLLSHRKNASAGNRPFLEKIETYFRQNERTQFAVTQSLSNYRRWTPEEVSMRHIEYLRRCRELWITEI